MLSHNPHLNSLREGVGVGQSSRGRASLRTDQVVKGRGVRDTGREVLQIPQVTQSLEDGGSRVRGRLASGGVNTVVLDVTLGSVGRNEPSGHTATETVELESVAGAIGGLLGVGLVVGADGQGGSDVVVETTCLVEGDQQQGLLPLGTGADGIVDLLQQDLTGGDVAVGVHGVGVKAAAGGVEVGQLGEGAQVGVLVEVLEGNDAGLGVGNGPVEEQGVGEEGAVGAVVVLPGDALLGGNLEDAGDVNGRDIEVVVVLAVAVGSTGDGTETVGVGGLDFVSDVV